MAYEAHGYLRKVLSPGETVLYVVRQHGFFLFARMFLWLGLGLVIAVGVAGVAAGSSNPGAAWGLVLLTVPVFAIWWQYVEWANHSYVLTNRRVIQLTGVISKSVVDSLLEKLNDIKTEQSLFGRMFNYGDVEILTANEVGNNVFRHISHPLEFKTTMLDAKQRLEATGGGAH